MKRFVFSLIVLALSLAPLHAARKIVLTPEFQKKFAEVARAYYAKDYPRTLALADEAEKTQPGTHVIPNLRGAVALDQKNYEEAQKWFDEALRINPQFFSPRYNLVDILFQQGKYADARTKYETLLAADPKNELVHYRIFLTYLMEKNVEKAEETMNAIKFPGQTAAYYFAHAAWEVAHGNVKEAGRFLGAAESIFGRERTRLFCEPLEELGWLKRREPSEEEKALLKQ